METKNLAKAGILTLILVVCSVAAWEIYLCSKGIPISYDNGKELWADKRAMVYEPSDKATVFIGSSRNKYDLDIETWKSLTGDQPIQLAMEGTSPLPVLDDLANDKNFKGKLLIDVTEILFLSTFLYCCLVVLPSLHYRYIDLMAVLFSGYQLKNFAG